MELPTCARAHVGVSAHWTSHDSGLRCKKKDGHATGRGMRHLCAHDDEGNDDDERLEGLSVCHRDHATPEGINRDDCRANHASQTLRLASFVSARNQCFLGAAYSTWSIPSVRWDTSPRALICPPVHIKYATQFTKAVYTPNFGPAGRQRLPGQSFLQRISICNCLIVFASRGAVRGVEPYLST